MEEDNTKSYRIKDIKFFGSARRILLQSANGPCPLLALCNVLLLRNQLHISQDARYISFDELVGMVTNVLFDLNKETPGESNTSRAANVRENLNSCLDILPRLNVGLDVNCKFGGPAEFEYTRELTVFDLLDIPLYHGWIVSSQDEQAYKAFGHLSYNQVVEKLVAMQEAQAQQSDAASAAEAEALVAEAEALVAAGGSSGQARPSAGNGTGEEAQKVIEEGLLIKEFMDRTASQLSYEGLLALHEIVRERQLAVFFRNSHFGTILKYEGDLYLLCTDIAFGASHICWEKLNEVDGDTSYCDADFQINTAASDDAAAQAAAEAVQEQYLAAAAAAAGQEPAEQTDADAALAMQLLQEDIQAQQQAQAQQQLQFEAQQAQAYREAQQQHQQRQQAPKAKAKPRPAEGGSANSGERKKKSGKACVLQ